MEKTLLIAGGTDGIGLALLNLVKRDFSKIYVLGRNFTKIGDDENIVKLVCDITDYAAVEKVLSDIPDGVDIFANTIGTFHKSLAENDTLADIRGHFELNAIANIHLTNLVLPKLRKDFSQIVVCSAYLALQSEKTYSLQAATKGAYKFYLDAIRKEYADRIRVMVLFPKSFQTEIFSKAGDGRDISKYPTAEEMADVMRYMISSPQKIYIKEIAVEHFGVE